MSENEYNNRQIILDTETTGLSVLDGDRIIEVAALEMIDRKLTNNYLQFYINPQRSISSEAFEVHGIKDEFLQDKPIFSEIADELFSFINNSELIIHNAPFDIAFLNYEFSLVNLPKIEDVTTIKVLDTLLLARQMYKGKKNSLDALCERLNIDKSNRTLHGALIDCDLLAKVYLAMTSIQFELSIEDTTNLNNIYEYNIKEIEEKKDKIKLIYPNDLELELHNKYLDELNSVNNNYIYKLIENE